MMIPDNSHKMKFKHKMLVNKTKLKKIGMIAAAATLVTAKGTVPVMANYRSRPEGADIAIAQIVDAPDYGVDQEEAPMTHWIGHEDGTQEQVTPEVMTSEALIAEIEAEAERQGGDYIPIMPLPLDADEAEEFLPISPRELLDERGENAQNQLTVGTWSAIATGVLLVAAGGLVLRQLLKK